MFAFDIRGLTGIFSFITDHRKRLLKMMPKGSICAEIGVWKGDFSKRILEITKPAELHLIDPWEFQPNFPTRWYGGTKASDQSDMDEIFTSVRERFSENTEVSLHRGRSEIAHADFPDDFFDWVYVDGNHDYDFVRLDLELYLPKVKTGGYLTGDDYLQPSREDAKQIPVKEAVSDFVSENDVKIHKIIGGQFILRKN
ncbi:MAG: class I SAM-dependent methyltransferase [Candidatus Thalassarchaeaceae archaeon]|nr:class I SAM-dependent methyltransferase [Candidatus Thalassarchaeaceae archaeon]